MRLGSPAYSAAEELARLEGLGVPALETRATEEALRALGVWDDEGLGQPPQPTRLDISI